MDDESFRIDEPSSIDESFSIGSDSVLQSTMLASSGSGNSVAGLLLIVKNFRATEASPLEKDASNDSDRIAILPAKLAK
jgi:hypothetical protein